MACCQLKSSIEKQRLEKVSPPFEGVVAGTINYLIFTIFIPRPGWLIYSFIFIFISMKSKNIFNRKSLKSFRSSLRNKSTSTEAALWEPPRPQQAFALLGYHCRAATPPSKGGEIIMN